MSTISLDESPTVLLTHLQQLRAWQQQQQENLRTIQKDQFDQIKLEREKVQELLNKHCSNKERSSSLGNDSNKIQCNLQALPVERIETKIPSDNQKGPFRFLKKGQGLARFDSKNVRSRTRSEPIFKTKTKLNPNSPESRVLTRKLKLIPETRRKSDVCVETKFNDQIEANSSKEILERESDDLAEFEILEKVTRNCSFNSDSSLMNKLVYKGNTVLEENLEIYEETGFEDNSFKQPEEVVEHYNHEEPEIHNLSLDKVEPVFNMDDLRWKSTDIDDDNQSCSSGSSDSVPSVKPICNEFVEMVGLKKYCEEMMQRIAAGVAESSIDDDEFERKAKWKDLSSMDWSGTSDIDTDNETAIKKIDNQENVLKAPIGNANNDVVLKTRLKELEDEIAEFKKQNNSLVKLRNQHEKLMKQLTKEHEAFKKQQNEAKEKFEDYVKEEKLKLRKQKQAFENYQKSKKECPDKKEREEISALKNEVQRLQDELRKQKTQLSAECGRLRAHATSMETERARMKAETKRLENEKAEILAAFKQLKSKPPLVKRSVTAKKVPITKPKYIVKKSITPAKKSSNANLVRKEPRDTIPSTSKMTEPSDPDETKVKHRVRFTQDTKDTNKENLQEVGNICDETEYQEINHFDKMERIYFNGEREFVYNSGTRRLFNEDSSTETVYFYNGDVLLILPDKTEIYHFIDSGIKQTKYPDGMTLLEFPDGQEERLQKDGTKEVSFQDGSIHIFYPDGTQEIKSAEGSVLKIYSDGSEILELVNGEKEIHTKDFKRREFLDGTVKIAHCDGKVETRYSNGRVRIKDKDNNIIVDTKYIS